MHKCIVSQKKHEDVATKFPKRKTHNTYFSIYIYDSYILIRPKLKTPQQTSTPSPPPKKCPLHGSKDQHPKDIRWFASSPLGNRFIMNFRVLPSDLFGG